MIKADRNKHILLDLTDARWLPLSYVVYFPRMDHPLKEIIQKIDAEPPEIFIISSPRQQKQKSHYHKKQPPDAPLPPTKY